MMFPEVTAQESCAIHAVVRRIAHEEVLALKARRQQHLKDYLVATCAEYFVAAGTAPECDGPTSIPRRCPGAGRRPTACPLRILGTVGVEGTAVRDIRRVQSKRVDMHGVYEER